MTKLLNLLRRPLAAIGLLLLFGGTGVIAQSAFWPIPSGVCQADGRVLISYGTNYVTCLQTGASGTVLTSAGDGSDPTWSAAGITGGWDLNGVADAGVLDADADTTISAPTDDQVDLEVNSDDVMVWSNNTGGGHAYALPGATTHAINRAVVSLFDDFLSQLTEAASPWILNAGTDAEAIDPAINAQVGGVIRVTTGDAGVNCAGDCSQMVSATPVSADKGGLVFETRLHINTAVTDVQVCAGLTDITTLEMPATVSGTTITTAASDALVFCYDTAQTTDEWYAIGVAGDTDATGNAITGVAPVADTYQTLRIEADSDGATARFYIDGTLVVSLTANAVTAATSVFATVVADSTTTTSKTVDVDYVYVGHSR